MLEIPIVLIFLAAAGGTCADPIIAEPARSPSTTELPRIIPLRDGWWLKSSRQVKEEGDAVSSSSFIREGWYPISVPSTVLSALVKNGVYPDPRIGLNSFLIPDASDEFNEEHDLARHSYLPDGRNPWKDPYWYRTEFDLPRLGPGTRAWLRFNSINYRADVWLNGTKVAGRETVAGMFQRFAFDVTGEVREGANHLAVKIHPVDHPGKPDTQLVVFGPERGYRKEIMKDCTMVMSIGYDCMPTVPDRNMGICQGVDIALTGPVAIRDPFVVTDLSLPDTGRATLAISATLVNATRSSWKGILKGAIPEAGLKFETAVELGPGETREAAFSPRPVIENPRLWWPVNYGKQDLYRLSLVFEAGGAVSDSREIAFGVREVARELHERDGAHGTRVTINGKKVFCRGGYIQPEVLLAWDARRMETEVRYFTSANLNLVYFEDIPNPPEEFLEACDRFGLLFGNCFYGCYWMTPGSGFPEDLELLHRSTVDIIKRYRNHPSLILYMAMNEGDTREDVYEMWRKEILALDGTRFFIPSATFPDSRKDVPPWFRKDLPAGMTDTGASYTWQEPSAYFRRVREDRNWMFMMESGSASLPPIDSLRRFLPDLGKEAEDAPYPLNADWAHHGANHYYRDYDRALRRIHGEPRSVAEYCWKGHLVTADQHRSMFEAVNHRMWDLTSGFTQWKVNDCWPGVQWQIFDWYLKPMVSYYFIKRACEPLHVQLDLVDSMVGVVNNRLEPAPGLSARARVFDFDMKERWEKGARLDMEANGYRELFPVPETPDGGPVRFVELELRSADGSLASDNFYWLPAGRGGGLEALRDLPDARLETSSSCEREGDGAMLRVRLSNPGPHLAFFIHLAATREPFGEEILPVFWEDNYFSLLPGESREVKAAFSGEDLRGIDPAVEVSGWNVPGPYECARVDASKPSVKPGETFTATAAISNTSIDGSKVVLIIDGKASDSRWVWARGGAVGEARFTLRLTDPGSHELEVGGRRASVQVER